MTALLVVTDLDGTLLDHDSYSFAPAQPALDEIARREIPLVLASSKTRVEMEQLQTELGLSGPYICENGAAICLPGQDAEPLVPPRSEVLAVLAVLREQRGYHFRGFADCSVAEIADMTGLSMESAKLAAAREYSEPLVWEDDEDRVEGFLEALAGHGLRALQGGRFLSVAGFTDKGHALTRLRQRYPGNPTVIALGDSPNDEAMLAASDIAVIIKSQRSDELAPEGPGRIIRTRAPGPSGWQEAMSALLEEYQ